MCTRTDLLLNSPLLCNLILPLHLLLLKLSDVPHSNLLTELNKHLILHLESKYIYTDIGEMQHRSASKWSSLCVSLTRFMRSRRSVISLSRDWMILLMSLMRGPKFASSLSSLDFSCMTQMKQVLKHQLPRKLWTGKRHWGVARLYLHVEGQVAGFCLFKITLGVLESHLKTVGLRLHLPQFSLLPLGFHLLLQRKTSRNGSEFSLIDNP